LWEYCTDFNVSKKIDYQQIGENLIIASDGKIFLKFTGTIRITGFFSCIRLISSWIAQINAAVRSTDMETFFSLAIPSSSFTDMEASLICSSSYPFPPFLI